jgi:Neuraminidase (sialidase)
MDRSHEVSFEHSGQTFDVHDNDGRAKEFDEQAQTDENTKQRATAPARPANNIIPASKNGGEKSSHKHIHDMNFSTGELDRVPSESPPTGCSRGREQATVSQCLRPASTLQPQTF